MPAQVWIRHLKAVEARGGRLLNSFFVTAPGLHNTTALILTLITDEPAEPQEGLA